MTISSKLQASQQVIRVPSSRDEILGLARLLRIGKASAEIALAGDTCVALLEGALTAFLQRNGFSRHEIEGPVAVAELMPLPTLLRALEYARAEAIAPLNDEVLAAALTDCIALVQERCLRTEVFSLPSTPLYN